MKKIFLFLFVSSLFLHTAVAQEAATEDSDEVAAPAETTETTAAKTTTKPRPKSLESWGVSLSALQWNEPLKLQQGVTNDTDYANFNGMTVSLQKEITYYRWGWSMGAFLGSGRASGGGNSSAISYEKGKVAFTVYGVSPRVFYRLSGRINTGLTAMIFMKNIDWPKDASNQTISSGRNTNLMGLLDLNVRLFPKWDFYSGIGPLAEGATLWKVGVNYRF